jgi:hypothetical protein
LQKPSSSRMLRIGLSVLIPPSLRDWIAEDHLVWTVCESQRTSGCH